jgi:hypothetical protein
MGPLDGRTGEELLSRMLDRLVGLGDPLVEQADGHTAILSVVLAAGAAEAVRRWRRRKNHAAARPPRCPRGLLPGHLS